MNIYQKIQQLDTSKSEEKIRNMILGDPFRFVTYTPSQISKKLNISRATFYRFCDRLNVSGYSDLKVRLMSDYEDYTNSKEHFDFDYPVKGGVNEQVVVQSLKEDYEKTLQATYNMFDTDIVHRVALEMQKAQFIDVYATAGNVNFAENFAFQMAEIGKNIQVPHEQFRYLLTASSSDETHLAIVISVGGNSILGRPLMRILNERNTKIVVISTNEAKSMYKDAAYHLSLPKTEDNHHKISGFSTRLSVLYVLDVLYTSFFELEYEKNLKAKTSYLERMGPRRRENG